MSQRSPETVSSLVSQMRTELDELKTKQFTSQESGMTFFSAEPNIVTPHIKEETKPLRLTILKVTSYFQPQEFRPTLVIPTIRITSPDYEVEELIDENFINRKKLLFKKNGQVVLEAGYSPLEHRTEAYFDAYAWVSILSFTGKHPPIDLNVIFSTKNSTKGVAYSEYDLWEDV